MDSFEGLFYRSSSIELYKISAFITHYGLNATVRRPEISQFKEPVEYNELKEIPLIGYIRGIFREVDERTRNQVTENGQALPSKIPKFMFIPVNTGWPLSDDIKKRDLIEINSVVFEVDSIEDVPTVPKVKDLTLIRKG